MHHTDYPPGTPVWVICGPRREVGRRSISRRRKDHRIMGRVVQVYRSDGSRPSILVRLAEDHGAYRRGSVAAFSFLYIRRRDVDRRKERS